MNALQVPRRIGVMLCGIFAAVGTPILAAVPAGWEDKDIGSPTVMGSTRESAGMYTITAGGRDMLAARADDQLHILYQPISGDFEIVAHLVGRESSGTTKTRVGLMARDGTDPQAPYQFLQMVQGELSGLHRDGQTKAVSHPFEGRKISDTPWLAMIRRQDRLRAAWSKDGKRWQTMLDLPSSGLPEKVWVGLAASAGSEKGQITATFDNVYVGPPRANWMVEDEAGGATLYNGIHLPTQWPPSDGEAYNGKPPPYLHSPPAVIAIDVGRQLFVDDFLIDHTDLTRTFHQPQKYAGNPILKPETPAEREGGFLNHKFKLASGASPFDDGVFFDPQDGLFKMWCSAGNCHDTTLVYSKDGIHWERPSFDVVPGTNIVIPYDPDFARDGFSPWIDYKSANPAERYKAFFYARSKVRGDSGYLYVSPDGIHWSEKAKVKDGSIGDNTLMFYNPFRAKWCLSIRRSDHRGRIRHYLEADDFAALSDFARDETVFWAAADAFDKPDPGWIVQDPTQLYTIAATPYESLMLGVFTVHYGPHNDVCDKGKFPKLTELKIAFSRDGFHWDRSNRDLFIAATKKDGDWDRGYLRAAGGCCLIVGDKLYFYYNAHSGYNNDQVPYMYAGGSTHVAMLRRDGFASMDSKVDGGDAGGELVTRPVRFGGKRLFVNLEAPGGTLTAEVLDENGKVIEPFSRANCIPTRGDGTKMKVSWKGVKGLGDLAGRPVKFHFRLTNGRLYAFWVSPGDGGESLGYVAAGGPGFGGPTDSPRAAH